MIIIKEWAFDYRRKESDRCEWDWRRGWDVRAHWRQTRWEKTSRSDRVVCRRPLVRRSRDETRPTVTPGSWGSRGQVPVGCQSSVESRDMTSPAPRIAPSYRRKTIALDDIQLWTGDTATTTMIMMMVTADRECPRCGRVHLVQSLIGSDAHLLSSSSQPTSSHHRRRRRPHSTSGNHVTNNSSSGWLFDTRAWRGTVELWRRDRRVPA